MDTLVKINSQTVGRDKIARLLQYLSRVLWNRLQHSNKDSMNGFKNLEFQLSTFRKLLRFGRCADFLYAILPLFSESDPTIKNALILSKIGTSIFLLADHVLWLGRADVCTINTDKWSKISNKYWLLSITMNLVRDFYEICRIIKTQKEKQNSLSHLGNLQGVISLVDVNRHVVIDLIKNSCDIFIPLAALGHVKLSPGTVGWMGVISSIAGLIVLIDPKRNKLSPS